MWARTRSSSIWLGDDSLDERAGMSMDGTAIESQYYSGVIVTAYCDGESSRRIHHWAGFAHIGLRIFRDRVAVPGIGGASDTAHCYYKRLRQYGRRRSDRARRIRRGVCPGARTVDMTLIALRTQSLVIYAR